MSESRWCVPGCGGHVGKFEDCVTEALYGFTMEQSHDAESWLDAHRREEFEAFRRRFTDEEWAAFRAGECGHSEDGNTYVSMCRASRRHDRIYCGEHHLMISRIWPDAKIIVPVTVRHMELPA